VLTSRESEVLRLLVEGRTDREIAAHLFISPRTVSVHVARILEKLGTPSRSAAAVVALQRGLIGTDVD
jgi:DNA-binding NarL/FixJ family response regulator